MVQIEALPTRTTALSADCVGKYGTMSDIRDVYADILPRSPNANIEVFAFHPIKRLEEFIQQAEDCGFTVVSVHGATGAGGKTLMDNVILYTADRTMMKTPELVEKFGASVDVLFHAPVLSDKKNFDSVVACKPKMVWVEKPHAWHTGNSRSRGHGSETTSTRRPDRTDA